MHIVTDALLSLVLAFKEPEPIALEPPFVVGKAQGPTLKQEEEAKARAERKRIEDEATAKVNARQSAEQRKKPVEVKVSTQRLAVRASFYTAYCAEGCTGVTATGIDVSSTQHYEGRRIIATDPAYIATGSTGTLELSNGDSYTIVAQDRGGAIKGNRIDVLVASEGEAVALGRLTGTITLD